MSEITKSIEATLGLSETAGCINFSEWVKRNLTISQYRYNARITGIADGLDDYEIENLRSFTIRRRKDDPSYFSLVIAYSIEAFVEIASRQNGEIVLDMVAYVNGQESLREEIIRVDYSTIKYDKSSNNAIITVTGYSTFGNTGARVELLEVTTETMLADGRMQYRCSRLDFYLKPGDTAIYGNIEFLVGQVSSIVSPNSKYMDVIENG